MPLVEVLLVLPAEKRFICDNVTLVYWNAAHHLSSSDPMTNEDENWPRLESVYHASFEMLDEAEEDLVEKLIAQKCSSCLH